MAIFELLQGWKKNHSQMEALNDIIIDLYLVTDGKHLEWFQRVFQRRPAAKSGEDDAYCVEALFSQAVQQGIGRGIEKGVVVGRIRTLQEVRGQFVTSQPELWSRSVEELQAQVAELELLLRQRQKSTDHSGPESVAVADFRAVQWGNRTGRHQERAA